MGLSEFALNKSCMTWTSTVVMENLTPPQTCHRAASSDGSITGNQQTVLGEEKDPRGYPDFVARV